MRTPAGVENWYLEVVDGLAPGGQVGTLSIEGLDWAEVDFLTDVEAATRLTDGWRDRPSAGPGAAATRRSR